MTEIGERVSPRVMSLLYAVIFLHLSSQGRFSSLMLSELGLSNSEVGLVLAFGSIAALGARPIVTSAFDRLGAGHRAARLVIIVSTLGAMLSVLAYGGGRVYPLPFWRAALARISYDCFSTPIHSCMSAFAMRCLPDKRTWGRTRLWGAVSWGLSNALVLGPAIDRFGAPATLSVANTVTSVLLLGAVVVLLPAPAIHASIPTVESEMPVIVADEEVVASASRADGLELRMPSIGSAGARRRVLAYSQLMGGGADGPEPPSDGGGGSGSCASCGRAATPAAKLCGCGICRADGSASAAFLVLMVVFGAGTSLVEGLVFLYWQQTLGASAALCGVSVLVTVSFEVPLFLASSWLVTHCSPRALLASACVAYSSRVAVYAVVPAGKGWLVLLCEPLHGVTYSLGALGAVHYVSALARANEQASSQGVADSLRSIGGICANLLGGGVMDRFGSRALYAGSACCVGLAMCAYLLATMAKADSIASRVCEPGHVDPAKPPACHGHSELPTAEAVSELASLPDSSSRNQSTTPSIFK